jgi:hypothetical protein
MENKAVSWFFIRVFFMYGVLEARKFSKMSFSREKPNLNHAARHRLMVNIGISLWYFVCPIVVDILLSGWIFPYAFWVTAIRRSIVLCNKSTFGWMGCY